MKLIFEKSVAGRRLCHTACLRCRPPWSCRRALPGQRHRRLPEMSETDISRHYSELCRKVHGVN